MSREERAVRKALAEYFKEVIDSQSKNKIQSIKAGNFLYNPKTYEIIKTCNDGTDESGLGRVLKVNTSSIDFTYL